MLIKENRYIFYWLLILLLSSCYDNPYKQGERIYNDLCSNCHMQDGSGLGHVIPSLSEKIPTLTLGQQICLLQKGINADSLGEAMQVMPSFTEMTDINMVNLINFINKAWNPEFKELSAPELKHMRLDCNSNKKGYNN